MIVISFFIFDYIACIIFPVNYLQQVFNYSKAIPNNFLLKSIIVIYFSITAGFVEEFFNRGLFSKIISNPILYVILSSVIFCSVHWGNGIQNIFSSFCYGIVCALFYLKYKNIWPLIIGHLLTDIFTFS